MAVTVVGGLAGQVINSGGLNTLTNTGLAINQHDTLLLFFFDIENAATTTVTGLSDNKTNTWSSIATFADAVIDGTHHASASAWLCKDAAAAAAAALTVTVTLSNTTHWNAYALVVLRGADNTSTVANGGGAVGMSSSNPGSAPNPTTFTSTSVTDTTTADQAIGVAACWPATGADTSAAGTGATKIVSITQGGGPNVCAVSLNAGSVNGTNNVAGSICNPAQVAALLLGTVVIAAPGAASPAWVPQSVAYRRRTVPAGRGRRTFFVADSGLPVPAPSRARAPRIVGPQPRGRRSAPAPRQIPTPASVPGNRRSSARARFGMLRRGRQANPILTQAAAPAPALVARRAAPRRLLAGIGRGKRTVATVENGAPVRQPRLTRPRLVNLLRGRQSGSATMSGLSPVAPPVIYTPYSGPIRHFLRLGQRPGRRTTPVPAQVPVPPAIPANRWSAARSKIAAARRGRQTNPVLTQAAGAPPAWLPTRPTPVGRLAAAIRGRRTGIAPGQDMPPGRQAHRAPTAASPPRARRTEPRPGQGIPLRTVRARARPGGWRRGRRLDPVPAQVPVPRWPPRWIRSLPRPALLRRGRKSEPPWPQEFPSVLPEMTAQAGDTLHAFAQAGTTLRYHASAGDLAEYDSDAGDAQP